MDKRFDKEPSGITENNVFIDKFNEFVNRVESEIPVILDDGVVVDALDDKSDICDDELTGSDILDRVEERNSGEVDVVVRHKFFDAVRGLDGSQVEITTSVTPQAMDEELKNNSDCRPTLLAEIGAFAVELDVKKDIPTKLPSNIDDY